MPARPRGLPRRVFRLARHAHLGLWISAAWAGAPAPVATTQLPTGAQVVAGQVGIAQSGSTLQVTQGSQRAIVNWSSFDIGADARVDFLQPGAGAVILNRVQGGQASQILGQISSNGQVFLVNPSGVLFGASASVDVGGLVATTHGISDANFLVGDYLFERDGTTAGVTNQGDLRAASGGYVALLAPTVVNQGRITASQGTVVLAAAETVRLQVPQGLGLAGIELTPAQVQALVDNQQAVQAAGGQIILSAQAADHLLGGVVKNSGTLEASGLVRDGGRVLLQASGQVLHTGTIRADAAAGSRGNGGTVQLVADTTNADSRATVTGVISARGGALGGDGGQVETSASHLDIAQAQVDASAPRGKAGTWLLDPSDLVIDASFLATTSTIAGSSELNSPAGWQAASGSAINTVYCGASGCAGSTTAPYVGGGQVTFSYGTDSVSKTYALAGAGTVSLTATVAASGFANQGNAQLVFLNAAGQQVGTTQASATFTQNGSTQSLSLASVAVPAGATQVQLVFAQTASGNGWAGNYGITFSGIALSGSVNGVVSALNGGTSVTVATSGTGAGSGNLTVATSILKTGGGDATLTLKAHNDLVIADGVQIGSTSGKLGVTLVSDSDGDHAGGIVLGAGSHIASNGGDITLVAGDRFVNLAGAQALDAGSGRWQLWSQDPTLDTLGGLDYDFKQYGAAYGAGTAVQGSGDGLLYAVTPVLTVGLAGSVSKTYDATTAATLSASQFTVSGALAGDVASLQLPTGGTYASGGTAGRAQDAGSGKLVTADGIALQSVVSDTGKPVYGVVLGNTTASAAIGSISQASLVVSSTAAGKTYDGTTTANATAVVTGGQLFGSDSISGGTFAYADANAGQGKTVNVSGVSVSDGNGGGNYAVTYAANTTSSIAKASLVVSSTNASKTYDATTAANATAVVTGGQLFGSDSISGGTFSYADANAGQGKTVNVSGVSVNDGNGGGNYAVTYAANTTSSIAKASLVVSSTSASKTYDATTSANATAVVTGGQLFGSDSISGGTFSYADANAGQGKTVNVSGVSVNDGNGGGNYAVTYAANTTSSIAKASLVVSSTSASKTYDATTAANATAVVTGGQLFGSDSISGGTFSYADANAGQGKTVNVAGVSVNDGNGGGNYAVTYDANTTSSIDKASLVISAADLSKAYDATAAANGSAVVVGGRLFGGDTLAGGSFAYDSAAAGQGKTVTIAGVSVLDGNGGANYSVTYAPSVHGTIVSAPMPPAQVAAGAEKPQAVATAPAPLANPSARMPDYAANAVEGSVDASTLGLGRQDAPVDAPPAPVAEAAAPAAAATSAEPATEPAAPATAPANVIKTTPAPTKAAATARAARPAAAATRSATAAATAGNHAAGSAAPTANGRVAAPRAAMPASAAASGALVGKTCPPPDCIPGVRADLQDAARAVMPRGPESAPGDPLTESFHGSAWLGDAGLEQVGRSRATRSYGEQLESVNLLNTLTLILLH